MFRLHTLFVLVNSLQDESSISLLQVGSRLHMNATSATWEPNDDNGCAKGTNHCPDACSAKARHCNGDKCQCACSGCPEPYVDSNGCTPGTETCPGPCRAKSYSQSCSNGKCQTACICSGCEPQQNNNVVINGNNQNVNVNHNGNHVVININRPNKPDGPTPCNAEPFKFTSVSGDLDSRGGLVYPNVQAGIDLILRTVEQGSYAGNSAVNGQSGEFGQINIQCGTETQVEALIVKSGTTEPVFLESIPLTVYDMDEGKKTKGRVSIQSCGFSGAAFSKNTELSSFDSGGCMLVGSCAWGTGKNNPKSVGELTDNQRKRVVSMYFANTAKVTFKLKVAKCTGGRNFLFAFNAGICGEQPNVDDTFRPKECCAKGPCQNQIDFVPPPPLTTTTTTSVMNAEELCFSTKPAWAKTWSCSKANLVKKCSVALFYPAIEDCCPGVCPSTTTTTTADDGRSCFKTQPSRSVQNWYCSKPRLDSRCRQSSKRGSIDACCPGVCPTTTTTTTPDDGRACFKTKPAWASSYYCSKRNMKNKCKVNLFREAVEDCCPGLCPDVVNNQNNVNNGNNNVSVGGGGCAPGTNKCPAGCSSTSYSNSCTNGRCTTTCNCGGCPGESGSSGCVAGTNQCPQDCSSKSVSCSNGQCTCNCSGCPGKQAGDSGCAPGTNQCPQQCSSKSVSCNNGNCRCTCSGC